MIISSSYSATRTYKLQSISFVIKQFLFAFISLGCINFVSKQEKHLKKLGHIIWIVNVFLLICVILFGHSAKGAKRWISFSFFNLQPSEFIKIGIIIQSSYYVYHNLYLYFLTYIIPISFILLQPDLGTALLLICLAFAQLIAKNETINWKLIVISFLSVFIVIACSYWMLPHVNQRIQLFLNSGQDIYGLGYQKHKSFLAIISGGLFGKGFGKGDIKDFLPDAHTDYIFSVIIEEFGAIGGYFVVLLFILLGLRCRQLRAKNDFFSMIQYSSVLLILGQAWLNISSTLSLIPSKGISIPLISYGGSGIIAQGIIFGTLLAVSVKKSNMTKAININQKTLKKKHRNEK